MVEIGPALEEDVALLAEQCENSKRAGIFDTEIRKIVMEEADACFLGQQDAKKAAEQIQSRVSIYLQE